MRIALATAPHYPDLAPDDQIFHAELRKRGIDASPVVWDGDADWSAYDIVVVRSIWDYHLKYPRFIEWLDALDASGARIHNPTEILRTNADKQYMLDLEKAGIRITPTRVIKQAESRTLQSVLGETGWQHVVVKPTVSSTGYETWFTSVPLREEDERRFADQTARMDVLVQEFAKGVSGGEMSLVFIDGSYSHSVLKRAASNEFRVHIEHGGTVESYEPTRGQLVWAQSVVDTIPTGTWTYARVDAVADDEGMMVMELELLDPELFFAYNASAVTRFADAIVR